METFVNCGQQGQATFGALTLRFDMSEVQKFYKALLLHRRSEHAVELLVIAHFEFWERLT